MGITNAGTSLEEAPLAAENTGLGALASWPMNVNVKGASKGSGLDVTKANPNYLMDKETENTVLQNMQNLADKINNPLRTFNEGMKDVQAWTQYNKSPAFSQREEAANTDRRALYDIAQQQASIQASQQQAQAEANNIARFRQGITGGGGGAGVMSPAHQQLLAALDTLQPNQIGAQRALIDEFNKQQIKGSSEAQYNPAAIEQKNFFIPGVGDETMSANDYNALPAKVKEKIRLDRIARLEGNPPSAVAPNAAVPTGGNLPVSVRNNNPGNLTENGVIKTFKTPEEGEAALTKDLGIKLSGQSDAVHSRFGPQVGTFMSPALLAETWAPSTAKGNTPESTQNYGKAIADSLGMADPTAQMPNTPEALAKAKAAITKFEAGPSSYPSPAVNTAVNRTTGPTATPSAPAKAPPPPIGMPDAAVSVSAQIPQFNEPKPNRASFPNKLAADEADKQWEKRRDAALEVYKEYEQKAGAESAKAFAKAEENFVSLTDDRKLGMRQTNLNSLNGWVNKWGDNPRVVGLLSRPDFGNAVADAIGKGISTPVGNLGIADVERLVQAGMPGLTTDEVQALKQLNAIMGPRILQIVEQTKGASSDKDWAAYQAIAGGASNGYDFLKKAVEYDKVSLKADKEDRQLYNNYNKGKQRTDYRGFAADPERSRIYDEYSKETDRIANTTYQSKKAPPKPEGMPKNLPAQWSESTQSYWIGDKQYKVNK